MHRTRNGKRAAGWVAGLACLLGAACTSNDTTAAPPAATGPDQYWSVTLDHHGITLSSTSPYDTIRLTATPRDVNGNPMSGVGTPVFTSADLLHVAVDSTGLVRALGDVSLVPVAVALSNGSVTHADTAWVSVVTLPGPPVMASLSIQVAPGDSAEIDDGDTKPLPATALDAQGDTINGLSVYYTSSRPDIAKVDPTGGFAKGLFPGRATIVATATAYGVTRTDSLPFVVGYPATVLSELAPFRVVGGAPVVTFYGPLTVTPGATVIWYNPAGNPATDIVFDDSLQVDTAYAYCFAPGPPNTICGAGNVPPFATDTSKGIYGFAVRRFLAAGTYRYHSSIFGTTGEVDVVDWRTIK